MADHCFGGNAVLPTVSATSWMVNVCEDLYPGLSFFAYDNYRLYKGIVFDGKQTDQLSMDVEEISVTSDEVTLSAKVWSTNAKGFRVNHYAADITLVNNVPENPEYKGFDSRSLTLNDRVIEPYKSGTLFHGASFQNIESTLNVSDSKLTLCCRAPQVAASTQGQFMINATNPFVDDVLYQAMLVWVRSDSGKGSLPSSAKRCEQFELILPGAEYFVSLDVVSSQPNSMIANITLHSESGKIYTRMMDAEVTISEALNPLFLQNTVEVGKVSAV